MGQKGHPYGLRLGYIKPWKARWFARKGFSENLLEDLKLREHLKKKLALAGISSIEIERSSGRVRVRIYTARPGVIIGRRGQEIEKLREELANLTGGELFLDIKEVKSPQIDAQLVAENIAMQIERRVSFRRAMKKTVQVAMSKGALGIKVACKGRLGGSEIARREGYREGKVPLNTFRSDVDYGFKEAFTTYGTIGCKVWIYKGDVLVKKEDEDRRAAIEGLYAAAAKTERKPKKGKKAAGKEAAVRMEKESEGKDQGSKPAGETVGDTESPGQQVPAPGQEESSSGGGQNAPSVGSGETKEVQQEGQEKTASEEPGREESSNDTQNKREE